MTDPLSTYRDKRDFRRTDEPGAPSDAEADRCPEADGPIFVVQHHEATNPHYDVRLEHDGVLISWAVPKGPSYRTKDRRLAIRVEAHPLAYATFEGTIPEGEYGGGTVMIWDRGTYTPRTSMEEGLARGELSFTLHGERLKGNWAMIRMDTDEDREMWLMIKEKDEEAKETVGIGDPTSVVSGRSHEEIAADAER